MNVIFKKVAVENFLSVAERVECPLEDQGLVLITGKNLDSETADSNGAGKSTIFESIVWVIWGKTVRGYSADEVVHRRVGKDCSVFLEFEHDGVTYSITRYRKHAQKKNTLEFWRFEGNQAKDLTQQTVSDTQKEIDGVLGVDYDTFIRGPMLPQGSFKRFSQMTDSEMKSILEQAVGVDILAQAHLWTKARYNEVFSKLNLSVQEQQSIEHQLNLDRDQMDEYAVESKQFIRKQVERTQALQEEGQDLMEQREITIGVHTPPDELLGLLENAQEAKKKVGTIYREAAKRWEGALQEVTEAEHEVHLKVGHHRGIHDHLKRRISKLTYLKEGECPECEQPVTGEMKKKSLEALDAELATQTDALISLTDNDLADVARRETEVMQARDKELTAAQVYVLEAQDQVASLQAQLAVSQQQVQELEFLKTQIGRKLEQIEDIRREESPWDRMISNVEVDIRTRKRRFASIAPIVRKYEIELEHLDFWRDGFSNQGLKSFLLDAVTPYMNQQATHYSKLLTGGELEIKFSTKTTLKTGKIKEQFAVEVRNKNGADTYAGNSGGEKARADLAINFVLSDLVAQRSSKSIPQRFFDEPFENVDGAGVEAIMDLLVDMAQAAGSVFVVTHQQGMQAMFNRSIEVVKENGRSTVKV